MKILILKYPNDQSSISFNPQDMEAAWVSTNNEQIEKMWTYVQWNSQP